MDTDARYLEVTWGRTLSIWWSFLWRGALLGGLAGGFVGFVAGIILALLDRSQAIGSVAQALGLLVSLPVSIWVVRSVLRKNFKRFTIRLVATPPA